MQRIQRKRTRGWRQPAGALYVGRPSKWANPWRVSAVMTREEAVDAFRRAFTAGELEVTPDDARAVLSGYDYLSCWCRLDQQCHADVLISAIQEPKGG